MNKVFFWATTYKTDAQRMAAMSANAETGIADMSANWLTLVPKNPKGWDKIEADYVQSFDRDTGYRTGASRPPHNIPAARKDFVI